MSIDSTPQHIDIICLILAISQYIYIFFKEDHGLKSSTKITKTFLVRIYMISLHIVTLATISEYG